MSGVNTTITQPPSDRAILSHGKAGVAIAVFFLTLLAELLPWMISHLHKAVEILSIGACLAGGVILGAGFCHMLPDSEEAWVNYFTFYTDQGSIPPGLHTTNGTSYPFAQFISVCSLLTLWSIDFILIRGGLEGKGHVGHSHAIPQLPAEYVEGTKPSIEMSSCDLTEADLASANGSTEPQSDIENQQQQQQQQTEGEFVEKVEQQQAAEPKLIRGTREQVIQAYIFFIALSLHSVFDGLSLGAEDNLDGFYALLGAIVGHKALDGFALGVPVFFAKLPVGHMWFALIFCAAMTPMGVGIAVAATDGIQGIHGQLSKAIILSISAGSFYFISLIELIPAGLQDGKYVRLKFLVIAIGFGAMALIAIWV